MTFRSSFPLKPTSRPGFSLIELLVVASVFSLTMLIGVSVFTSVQTRQNDVLRRQRLVADGRYVLETMARTARLEAIDYRYYYTNGVTDGNASTGPVQPATILVTRNEVNDQTCFRFDSVSGTIQLTKDCQTNPNWQTLTPPDLRVTDLRVWITPPSNPYAPAPRASTDCRVNPGSLGFDATSGVCRCRSAGSGFDSDCFAGQQCAYPLADQSDNDNGQGLCANSGVTCSGGLCSGGPRAGQTCSNNDQCRLCACRNANVQPHITLFLMTASRNLPVGIANQVTLQTTVVSRAYGR